MNKQKINNLGARKMIRQIFFVLTFLSLLIVMTGASVFGQTTSKEMKRPFYFDKDKPLIMRSLNYLEARLDEKIFFRASRKHIINLRWVETIEPGFDGRLDVKLTTPEIEMSRRQSQKFKELMSI